MDRKQRVLAHLTEGLNLPGEGLPGIPVAEIWGQGRVLIEHHKGVIGYCREEILPNVCLLSGLISNGTWYVAPPTLLALTSRTGITFSKAASNTSKGFFPSFYLIISNAS